MPRIKAKELRELPEDGTVEDLLKAALKQLAGVRSR